MLISTIGADGIYKICSIPLPRSKDVSYIVVWQIPSITTVQDIKIPTQLSRNDIRVVISDTSGLSRSRNIAIKESGADICMIADDDTEINPGAFDIIRSIYSDNNSPDIALLRISGKNKRYPRNRIRLQNKLPRGYWVTSSEITFKTSTIKDKLKFRENFGLGAPRFTAAEEAFFIADALRCRLTVDMVPMEICAQPQLSSGERPFSADGGFPASQGAYIRYTHGLIFGLPRIFVYAARAYKSGKGPFLFTLRHAFDGFTCKTPEML